MIIAPTADIRVNTTRTIADDIRPGSHLDTRPLAPGMVVGMRSTTTPGLLLAATLALAVTGCTAGPTGSPASPSPDRPSSSAAPTDTTAPTSAPSADPTSTAPTDTAPTPTCGPTDGATVVGAAVARLAAPSGLPDARWDASAADVSGYDACTALSWAVVPLAEGTASSPYAVLLFHQGTYLGTATKVQYPFEPQVARSSDAAIDVTYRYATATDPNAAPSGTARATYTWDTAAQRVVLTGDVPPTP